MKTNNLTSLILLLSVLLFFNCKNEKKTEPIEDIASDENYSQVEVITRAMEFQTLDTLRSGWTTFSYKNLSGEVHFFLMDKLPSDSIVKSDITDHLMPAFDDGMKYLIEEKVDSAMAAFGTIPTWFNDVKRYGGSGLISPGMWKFITVVDEPTDHKPSKATHTLSVSSTNGYEFDGKPTAGKTVFKVDFIDQVPHEHFSGHDVNLIKYKEGADMDALVHWLNWMNPDGLRTPAPDQFEFLGGMNNCEAGETGYFEGMLKTFVVD